MKKLYLVLIVTFCTLNTSCQETTRLPDHLAKALLYTESKDEDGIGTGDFCEIVAYDLKTGTTQFITNDRFYDRLPSYSFEANQIVFESKRFSDPDIVGLTADSKIFTIKLSEKAIKLLDNLYVRSKQNNLNYIENPRLSNDGKKLSFINYSNKPDHYDLFIYDYPEDSIYMLQSMIRTPFKFAWADNDNKVYYSFYSNTSIKYPEKSIYAVDLRTKSTEKIIEMDSTENYVSDIEEDKLLYTYYKSGFATDPHIKIHDLSKNNEIYSLNMNELGFKEIKSPVFESEDVIYFIGNPIKFEGGTGDDIYKMNLQTKKIDRITYNELMKEDLVFIK